MPSPFLRALAFAGRQLRNTPLARSGLLNRAHGALAFRFSRSSEAQVGPFRVHFDPRDRFIAKKLVLYGAYEPAEIALLCSLVRPGDCVLDAGANIGLFSLHLSRAVGPEGKVVAAEPDPDNLVLLRHNLASNGCDNVIVLPYALGAEAGHAQLFQDPDNRGNLSFADLANTQQSISVSIRRGSDALNELGLSARVAKLDVEGAEPSVLAGLDYGPDVVLFEFYPYVLRALGHDPEEFLSALLSRGYSLEHVDPDSGARTFVSPAQIMARVDFDSAGFNLLATRSARR